MPIPEPKVLVLTHKSRNPSKINNIRKTACTCFC
jgi:hypothetical protein